MMDAVHQYDGFVAQALGDGIFAFFGRPLPMKIIPSEHYSPRYACKTPCGAMARVTYAGVSAVADAGRSKHGRSGAAVDSQG